MRADMTKLTVAFRYLTERPLKFLIIRSSSSTRRRTRWENTPHHAAPQYAQLCLRGTGVYMREGTTSRVTAADRPYGEFYSFYSVSPENFGSTHVCCSAMPVQCRPAPLCPVVFHALYLRQTSQ
jgi:hypothetical protein